VPVGGEQIMVLPVLFWLDPVGIENAGGLEPRKCGRPLAFRNRTGQTFHAQLCECCTQCAQQSSPLQEFHSNETNLTHRACNRSSRRIPAGKSQRPSCVWCTSPPQPPRPPSTNLQRKASLPSLSIRTTMATAPSSRK
jgi:hypothetical protein